MKNEAVTMVGIGSCAGREERLILPRALARRFNLEESGRITLRAGTAVSRLPYQVEPAEPGAGTGHSDAAGHPGTGGVAPPITLHLPKNQRRHLGLEGVKCLRATYREGQLRLGPLIGVMAPRRKGTAKPYSAQTTFFRRLMLAREELGVVVFVFDFHHISFSQGRVRGYTYENDKWVSRTYPLPDVIYDRASGSFAGGAAAADAVRRRLTTRYGIKLFNTRMGGKMRLYRCLRTDPLLRAHLPATYRYAGSATVARAMSYSHSVYMKPANGGQGKGIIRLRRLAGGTVEYALVTQNYTRVRGQAPSIQAALARLRGRVALSRYLVQPDIKLIKVRGRVCDVRALIQRDSNGAWHLTGAAVRAGKPGEIISNLHGGGKAMSLPEVWREVFGEAAAEDKAARIYQDIEKIALRVGEVLAKSTKCLGELGVDLGVDGKGKVWIIEANSRTGRAVFRRSGNHEAAKTADRRPLRFAAYLAGFACEEDSK